MRYQFPEVYAYCFGRSSKTLIKLNNTVLYVCSAIVQKMTTTREKIAIDSLSYQVVQKIKELRLLRGYSQAKLAKETGISTSQIRRYEQRIDAVSPENAEKMLKVLSASFKDIFPTTGYVNYKEEKMLSILQNLKKIKDQEFRSAFCVLVKLLSGEIQIGKSIIGTKSIKHKIGQMAKDWRFVRGCTQLELANKIGLSQQQIHRYEQGVDCMSFKKLSEAEKALVNARVLFCGPTEENYYEDEDSEGEMKILNIMKECQKIEDQRLQDLLSSFLSEVVKISEEKQNQ
ncbi:helix-turn-helix domain-containing protein [Wolbachia endosymbiont (group A) of Lasioglossum morio]|uniref:helix-turn-helix domain-containing protein n=1 Tax=Wolbachia endosymbiont (group A) of Lasioglossum morio TaxID=2954025 RepID=UPI002227D0BD|nr:helix-turn-helix transcriptional regulator [Wolbachia endosymbiont (group A) of Lasioglossum morio]